MTGAAGFVGAAVVRALLDNGDGVIACVHRPADLARFSGVPGVSPACVDILDPDALSAAMTGADDVYHFAALVDSHASRARLMTVNAAGTHNVWTCAAARRVRRALYCSSVAVYGLLGKGRQPITEEVPPRAIEPYGTSKLMGEWAVREVVARSGLPGVIIRPVAVFGPERIRPSAGTFAGPPSPSSSKGADSRTGASTLCTWTTSPERRSI